MRAASRWRVLMRSGLGWRSRQRDSGDWLRRSIKCESRGLCAIKRSASRTSCSVGSRL